MAGVFSQSQNQSDLAVLAEDEVGQPAGRKKRTPGLQRTSKACENCRVRRKKCTASPPTPCERCVQQGLAGSCVVREKARPGRSGGLRLNPYAPSTSALPTETSVSPSGGDGSGYAAVDSEGTGVGVTRSWVSLSEASSSGVASASSLAPPVHPIPESRTPFFRLVEMDLEKLYRQRTGLQISLAIPDEATHPFLSASLPRPLPPAMSAPEELSLVVGFLLSTVKRNLSFLSTATLLSLHSHVRSNPNTVQPDEMAVFWAMICLGKFRALTVDPTTGASIVPPSNDPRDDIALSRLASYSLRDCTRPSVLALQAIMLLHIYVQATGTTEASRELIGQAVRMAHALRLNDFEAASAFREDERVGQLYFYIVFVDCYHATLVGIPPLIAPTDYDARVFDSFNKTLVLAVLIQSSYLSKIYDPDVDKTSPTFVLGCEEQWYDWLAMAMDDPVMAEEMQDSLVAINYHWDRIVVRTPCIYVKSLAVSSLAVVARSASQVLNSYREIAYSGRLNLGWPQLRRIVTTAFLVIQVYWRREFQQAEAEELLGVAVACLGVLKTRWRAAEQAEASILALSKCLDLFVAPPEPPSQAVSPQSVGAQALTSQMPSIPSFVDTGSFDGLDFSLPLGMDELASLPPEELRSYLLDKSSPNNDWGLGQWMLNSGFS